MSTAQFAVPGVWAPLQSLWRWLMPVTSRGQPTPPGMSQRSPQITVQSISDKAHCPRSDLQNQARISTRRPLRIVRVLEADQAPTHVGRMTISGRMADVCAELDRLAARAATLH